MTNDNEGRVRLPPTTPTIRELYLYSGNRCAFPGCGDALLLDDSNWNCNVAHIYGVKENAARGSHNKGPEELRAPSNLLLLCLKHHEVVDGVDADARYPVAAVQEIKASHEKKYREAIQALERIVDVSDADVIRYPKTLAALDPGDEAIDELLASVNRWIDRIAAQAPNTRDMIALILTHSSDSRHGLTVSSTQIEGVASVPDYKVREHVFHLQEQGLLEIDVDEYERVTRFNLLDTISDFDSLFSELKRLTHDDRNGLRKAIVDLDFSIFDG